MLQDEASAKITPEKTSAPNAVNPLFHATVFVLTLPPDSEGRVRLAGKDHRYLCRVLRLRQGDSFPASLPSGEEVRVRIRSIGSTSMEGQVLREEGIDGPRETVGEPQPGTGGSVPPIILCQMPAQGPKNGSYRSAGHRSGHRADPPFRIRAFGSHRRKGRGGDSQNGNGGTGIVKGSRQQSGSPVAHCGRKTDRPTDGIIEFWKSFSLSYPKAVGIPFHQDPLAQGTLHGYLCDCPEAVILVVGPEGGFSDSEASKFLDAGLNPFC